MSQVATFARNVDGPTAIVHALGERGDKTQRISLFGETLSPGPYGTPTPTYLLDFTESQLRERVEQLQLQYRLRAE